MFNKILCGRARQVLTQTSGLQKALALRVGRSRTFSAASSDEPYIADSHTDSGPRTVWPDENMGPFGPQDKRFQLPGNVGFDCHLEGTDDQIRKAPVHRTVPDVLSAPSSLERNEFVLAQFISEFQGKEAQMPLTKVRKAEHYFDHSDIDCSIKSCPELLKKDLEMFFPAAPVSALTVVTVTQKNSRCEGSDQEREQLLHQFVSGAKEMCFALWTAGFWADFINPSSGLAYFGSPSSQTSLRADEEQSHLGFHIEVSGSCTVISHILRGTPLFVGTVFTNAPPYSHVVERLQGLANGLNDRD
ncbi:metabolism of cobalamin associated Da [Aplochiton taeniatus]